MELRMVVAVIAAFCYTPYLHIGIMFLKMHALLGLAAMSDVSVFNVIYGLMWQHPQAQKFPGSEFWILRECGSIDGLPIDYSQGDRSTLKLLKIQNSTLIYIKCFQ